MGNHLTCISIIYRYKIIIHISAKLNEMRLQNSGGEDSEDRDISKLAGFQEEEAKDVPKNNNIWLSVPRYI